MRCVYIALTPSICNIWDVRLDRFTRALHILGGQWGFRRRNTGGVLIPPNVSVCDVARLPEMVRVTGFQTRSGNPRWVLR